MGIQFLISLNYSDLKQNLIQLTIGAIIDRPFFVALVKIVIKTFYRAAESCPYDVNRTFQNTVLML